MAAAKAAFAKSTSETLKEVKADAQAALNQQQFEASGALTEFEDGLQEQSDTFEGVITTKKNEVAAVKSNSDAAQANAKEKANNAKANGKANGDKNEKKRASLMALIEDVSPNNGYNSLYYASIGVAATVVYLATRPKHDTDAYYNKV